MAIVKRVCYYDTERKLEYIQEPIEGSIIVTEVTDGTTVKYLVTDDGTIAPDIFADDNVFLVHYHRDFSVEKNKIITKVDLANWYRGLKISQEKRYYIFAVSAYIHSGTWLSLSKNFAEDPGGWDTSHVGAVLVNKKEFRSRKKAEKAAESLVTTWNQYLTGDVYAVIKQKHDNNKNMVSFETVGGYYGIDYAKECLLEL